MTVPSPADGDPTGLRVLVVDNYDSFVYNLVQYVGTIVTGREAAGCDETMATSAHTDDHSTAGEARTSRPEGGTGGSVIVHRNDRIDLAAVDRIDPDAIVVSPGPGTPDEAGISIPLFEDRTYPTLGVCLGHQALCAAHGAPIRHADSVVHGKPSTISHDGNGIFTDLPERFAVGRYHSLAVDRTELPSSLVETARTEDEATVVMGVRHEAHLHVGVQFHPESILTDGGIQIVENFLAMAASRGNR